MSVTVTAEQQQAIDSRGRVIVSASAGSGKTFVMIERLVSLILSGADVRNVLCVTFTNKAAAQMLSRLRSALLKQIPNASGDALKMLKANLNALPLADISTIHAFCGRLVRTHFYLAGVDPSFRIISPDDAEGKTLSARALSETFDNAYEQGGEEFARLLSVYFRKKKDARLKQIVLSLYASVRDNADYRTVLEETGAKDNFPAACERLFEGYRERALSLKSETERRKSVYAEAGGQAQQVCADVTAACENLLRSEDLFDMAERARAPLAIGRMPSLTKAEGERLRCLKFLSGASKAVKALYGELREYADCAEERARCEDGNRRARALAGLALAYDDVYARLKREANVLDYNDLERLALEVLKNEDARREISEKYQYVFVDEYQDVNPVQEKIIFSLAGQEVFLVGDAKQAIYGFRGSRSEYFEQKERELEHSLRLTSNFRSSEAVLECVNRVFGALTEDYVPMRGGERYGAYKGGVQFRFIPQEERERAPLGIYSVLTGSADTSDALSDETVRLVEAEYGTEWYDADEELPAKRVKSVTYGDIAVLVRKNSGAAERIVHALAKHGIPVSTSAHVNVCDCFEARLLLDWLELIDNAEQDIPFATALLSEIGGFNEEELTQIRLRFPSPFTFRAACREYESKMKNTLSEKLKAFRGKLERYRALSNVRTAAEMLGTLLADGLEVQIASKADGRGRLARVRRLVSEAESAGSVHDFLTRLKAGGWRVDFSESAGENAVKVLTMHASKGLEYPVVILADTDTEFHGADRDEVMWTDEYRAAPRSFDEENKLVYDTVIRRAAALVQTQRELKDERNLLYVAMTRARYRLHVLFEGGEGALSPKYARRFSDFFDLAALSDYFAEQADAECPPIERKSLVYRPDGELLRELQSVYAKEYKYEASTHLPVKSSATALMKSAAPRQSYGGTAGYSADTGTAYHAFLEHAVFGEDAEKEFERMKSEGLLTEQQCALLDKEKLAEVLRIPCLHALAGKRVRREQTFLVSLPANQTGDTEAEDEIVFQGAIDLLAEDQDGYQIIDYKFSSHSDDRIREDYALQIALYRKAVARILRVDEKKVRARIVNIAQCREIEF